MKGMMKSKGKKAEAAPSQRFEKRNSQKSEGKVITSLLPDDEVNQEYSDADNRRLIQELQLHQIELKLQNEELLMLQDKANNYLEKYVELYDFAPSGYFTLSEEGEILELNLFGSQMLGMDRVHLSNHRLGAFVSEETKPAFDLFLQRVFMGKVREFCEVILLAGDNEIRYVHLTGIRSSNRGWCLVSAVDITERKVREEERVETALLIALLNKPGDFRENMAALTASLQRWTKCEAVGVRLREGDDYTYYETRGFPSSFIRDENCLCAYNKEGELITDSSDLPVLECMCGNILRGRFDPSESFFTAGGSFWSNNTSDLFSELSKSPSKPYMRYRCFQEGYESVALIPLRNGNDVFGLLQFNDHRVNRFTKGLIAHFEMVADNLAITLSRIQAEQALAKSQLLLKSSIESQKDTILLSVDQNFRYLYFNKTGSDYMKLLYQQDIKLGMNILDCITSEDDKKAAKEHYGRALLGESHTDIRESGNMERVWFESSFNPIVDDQNQIIGATSLSRNVTERIKMENSLRKSEAQLKTLIQTIPDLVWLKDTDGVYLSCNTMIERLFNTSKADIIGKTDYDFFDQDIAKLLRSFDHRAIEMGKPCSNEEWFTFKDDGHIALLETIKTPFLDSDGKPLGILGIGRDITDRKRAEDALQSSKERLEEAQRTARIGHWEANLVTGELYWSPVIFEIFGFDQMTFLPSVKAFHGAVHPDDRAKVLESEKLSEQSGFHNVVHRIIRPDNEVRYVHERARRIKDINGNLIMLRGTVQDITELKMAEAEIINKNAQLLKLNNEKDKFFSIIAHDLQSPFSALLGFTQMLDEELPTLSMEEIQSIATAMRVSSNNLYRLLGNLLEWSRMQRGATSFTPALILLMPKVEECMRLVIESANKKEIRVSFSIAEEMMVFADANMLGSTIRNLATNAVKFTPTGGEITIAARRREDNSVEISVRDTGIGMDNDLQEKLFKVGDQISRRGTGGETGTGLGLIICRDFIEKHGGKIWVESEVGKGSVISFILPPADSSGLT